MRTLCVHQSKRLSRHDVCCAHKRFVQMEYRLVIDCCLWPINPAIVLSAKPKVCTKAGE